MWPSSKRRNLKCLSTVIFPSHQVLWRWVLCFVYRTVKVVGVFGSMSAGFFLEVTVLGERICWFVFWQIFVKIFFFSFLKWFFQIFLARTSSLGLSDLSGPCFWRSHTRSCQLKVGCECEARKVSDRMISHALQLASLKSNLFGLNSEKSNLCLWTFSTRTPLISISSSLSCWLRGPSQFPPSSQKCRAGLPPISSKIEPDPPVFFEDLNCFLKYEKKNEGKREQET